MEGSWAHSGIFHSVDESTIQICENLVCILHTFGHGALLMDRLTVWDWTTGSRVMVSTMTQSRTSACPICGSFCNTNCP
jgi:hypothetical protein